MPLVLALATTTTLASGIGLLLLHHRTRKLTKDVSDLRVRVAVTEMILATNAHNQEQTPAKKRRRHLYLIQGGGIAALVHWLRKNKGTRTKVVAGTTAATAVVAATAIALSNTSNDNRPTTSPLPSPSRTVEQSAAPEDSPPAPTPSGPQPSAQAGETPLPPPDITPSTVAPTTRRPLPTTTHPPQPPPTTPNPTTPSPSPTKEDRLCLHLHVPLLQIGGILRTDQKLFNVCIR